tara:strand:- start:9291 stop:9641 length:351 start_codon:yes stop_codon:yes gene_type:complete
MPVLKKEIELNDGKKIWVRQASGMEKLRIENIQTKVFRKLRHYGSDPTAWTPEQHEDFAVTLDEEGGGMEDQINAWIPNCVISPPDFDINSLTSAEVRDILGFVRGDTLEGAVPLD